MSQVDESDDGKEIEITVGRTLEIRLKENPTAGFGWSLTSGGEPQCKLLDDSLETPSAAQGQGGVHSWKFRAQKSGEGHIKLAYARAWERDAKPAQTFTLKIKVTEK